MTRAAVTLRLTQSAVSKRIAALEAETGRRLVERDGRRARLTADGRALLAEVRPLLGALHDALRAASAGPPEVVLGVSESILASWGAEALIRAQDAAGVRLVLHAHRSPGAIDRVRSGEYGAAFVAGFSDAAPDLITETLAEEEMVVVPSRLDRKPLRGAKGIDVLAIEPSAATHRAVARRVAHLRRAAGVDLRTTGHVESYGALVAMARAGFGHALVPAGIARAMGVSPQERHRLPPPGLTRPVSLVARRTTFGRAAEARLRDALRGALANVPGLSPSP